ncbi:hypothetical protein [Terriglobus sp. TAA 43]|uniref:hypothetical protein n=1 Tax=Terriglobus sp. TAA 43 TaxID=278961 RepID=UPI0006484E32|nr:hypothetical protein [Terriglobus sp. TAA 43]
MNKDDEIVASLDQKGDSDLQILVQQNMRLSRAIFADMPALAIDAGYEPFSKDWMNSYWRSLLIQISGKPVDKIFEWALKTGAASIAALLLQRFGLDLAEYSAAIALAILLLRAASAANKEQTPSSGTQEGESALDR